MSVPALLARYRARFEADLERYGFAKDGEGHWRGFLDVTWYDADGTQRRTDEEVRIELRAGFPFAKPRVTPLSSEPVVADSLHREEEGPACLWRDDSTGWHPGMDAMEVLARTREWFVRCREGAWRPEERPADLHLYYPGAGTQTIVAIGDDWKPPAGAQMGRFGVWQTNSLIAFAGDPQVRLASPGTRNSNRVLKRILVNDEKLAHVGIWFRVDREPMRMRNASALFAFLDTACDARQGAAVEHAVGVVGAKIRGTKRFYVALGYPGPMGDEHWLFLTCDVSGREGKRWSSPEALKTIGLGACVTAPADKEALMRRVGPLATKIDGKRVVIFGVGAIGSAIALLLAKSGVPKLTLVDGDRLTPTNAVRHATGLRYAGTVKTFAVEQEVLDHAPHCNVQTSHETSDPDEIAELISDADIVVDATASTPFSFLLNEIAISAEKPVIYVAAHRRASVGRIRLVRPHRDACVTCYEAARGHIAAATYPVIPPTDEGAFIEEGCGTPTVEGTAIHLELTANTAARLVLNELDTAAQTRNHVLVVIDPIPEARQPLNAAGVHESMWPPVSECESCGENPDTSS